MGFKRFLGFGEAKVEDAPPGTIKMEVARLDMGYGHMNPQNMIDAYVAAGWELIEQEKGASKYQPLLTFKKT